MCEAIDKKKDQQSYACVADLPGLWREQVSYSLEFFRRYFQKRGDNQSRSQEKQQQLQEDFAGLYATTDIHSITQTNESKQRGGLSFCYVLYSALYIYADLGYLIFLVRGPTENY